MIDIPRPYSISSDDFIIFISIMLFALFGYTWYRSKEMIAHKTAGLFSTRSLSGGESFYDSGNEIVNYVLFFFISAMSIGLIFFNHITLFTLHFESVQTIIYALVFFITALVCGYIIIKLTLYNIINWIFFNKETTTRWASDYCFITAMLAYIFFPLSMLKVFFRLSDHILHPIVLIVFLCYVIFLFLKSCVNFRPKNNGYLLLFLYLCTLEILPVLFFAHFLN